jgi:hypothetical protein
MDEHSAFEVLVWSFSYPIQNMDEIAESYGRITAGAAQLVSR